MLQSVKCRCDFNPFFFVEIEEFHYVINLVVIEKRFPHWALIIIY